MRGKILCYGFERKFFSQYDVSQIFDKLLASSLSRSFVIRRSSMSLSNFSSCSSSLRPSSASRFDSLSCRYFFCSRSCFESSFILHNAPIPNSSRPYLRAIFGFLGSEISTESFVSNSYISRFADFDVDTFFSLQTCVLHPLSFSASFIHEVFSVLFPGLYKLC